MPTHSISQAHSRISLNMYHKNSIITIDYPVYNFNTKKYEMIETKCKYLGQLTNKSHSVVVNYKLLYPLEFIFNTYKTALIEIK